MVSKIFTYIFLRIAIVTFWLKMIHPRITFPVFIILICGGCYPNRAVIDPWSYAPRSFPSSGSPQKM